MANLFGEVWAGEAGSRRAGEASALQDKAKVARDLAVSHRPLIP